MDLVVRPAPAWWSLLLALSVALTVAAPDHWGIRAPSSGHGHGHAHEHHEAPAPGESSPSHRLHCHESAATCSDIPLVSATGLAALNEWMLNGLPAAGLTVLAPDALQALSGHPVKVPTPPPRLLAV